MIFEEKQITLKDGRTAILKSPAVEDAEQLLNHIKTAFGETDFLSWYPEEWDHMTVEKEEAWINRARSSPDTMSIACYVDGRIIGICEINFKNSIKTRHRAALSITILRSYWSIGIGSAMFCELIAAAEARGTKVVELEFIEGNDRARYLYEKFGFRIVAEKPDAFRLKDGTMLKEFYMQKYL